MLARNTNQNDELIVGRLQLVILDYQVVILHGNVLLPLFGHCMETTHGKLLISWIQMYASVVHDFVNLISLMCNNRNDYSHVLL